MNDFFLRLTLTNKGEDSFCEFKSARAHTDSLAKEIIAFSNTSGGKIYLGIEDNGEVTGINKKEWEERVVQISRNNIEPSIVPIIKVLNQEKKSILEITIEKGKNKPYKVKASGKYYIRVGSVIRCFAS